MKSLLLIFLIVFAATGAKSQDREMTRFMRSVMPALHPRKDLGFYQEKGQVKDSLTGANTTEHTYYYVHKPTLRLHFVAAYRYTGGSRYPVIHNYYFAGDSLQKVGIFAHPKLCKGCYGVYSFANAQLESRQEEGMVAPDARQMLLKALEYELKAALFFKQSAQ